MRSTLGSSHDSDKIWETVSGTERSRGHALALCRHRPNLNSPGRLKRLIVWNDLNQGSAAFSLGPRTTINGNLVVQNVASGSSLNQICGAHVDGNMDVSQNATPFQLGSALPDSCPGNFVGGNLAVDYNTAAAAVFNNYVTKNLECGSNTSITGGGNTARSKQDQCAGF